MNVPLCLTVIGVVTDTYKHGEAAIAVIVVPSDATLCTTRYYESTVSILIDDRS